jgi:hypothetical protein
MFGTKSKIKNFLAAFREQIFDISSIVLQFYYFCGVKKIAQKSINSAQ